MMFWSLINKIVCKLLCFKRNKSLVLCCYREGIDCGHYISVGVLEQDKWFIRYLLSVRPLKRLHCPLLVKCKVALKHLLDDTVRRRAEMDLRWRVLLEASQCVKA